jgi:hypothetical protein
MIKNKIFLCCKMSSKNSDKYGWWYYFELIDDNKIEKCKSCTWQKERDKGKSTGSTRFHLEKKHPEKFREKIEATREKEESQKKRKIDLERQQAFFKPKPSSSDTDVKEIQTESTKGGSKKKKNFPVFGMSYEYITPNNIQNKGLFLGHWDDSSDNAKRLDQLIAEMVILDLQRG